MHTSFAGLHSHLAYFCSKFIETKIVHSSTKMYPSQINACKNARMHTRLPKPYTSSRVQAFDRRDRHTNLHKHIHVRSAPNSARAYKHTRTTAHSNHTARIQTQTCTDMHTHRRTHTHTCKRTDVHTHAQTPIHALTHTHSHTRTHARTHERIVRAAR